MTNSVSHISKNHEYFYVQDGFVKSERRGRFGKFGRVLSWVQGKDYRLEKILDIISEKQLPKTDLYARLIQHFYERKNRLPKSSQQKIDILLTKIFPHPDTEVPREIYKINGQDRYFAVNVAGYPDPVTTIALGLISTYALNTITFDFDQAAKKVCRGEINYDQLRKQFPKIPLPKIELLQEEAGSKLVLKLTEPLVPALTKANSRIFFTRKGNTYKAVLTKLNFTQFISGLGIVQTSTTNMSAPGSNFWWKQSCITRPAFTPFYQYAISKLSLPQVETFIVIPQTKILLQQILSKEMFENISSITESSDVSTKQITICFKDLYKQTHAQEIQKFCSLDPITLTFKDLQTMVDEKKKEQIQNDKKELEKISSEAKKNGPAFSTKIDALVVDGLSRCSRVPLEFRKDILLGLFKLLDEHKAKKGDESTTALLQKEHYIRLLRLCCMIQLRPDS